MSGRHEMKTPRKLVQLFFVILAFNLTAFVYPQDKPISSSDNILIRSEGATIKDGDTAGAKEIAIQNAIRKVIKSYLGQLTVLSKSESDKLMSQFSDDLNAYVTDYKIVKENSQNSVLRVILDVKIIPSKIAEKLIDSGFCSSIRHKPRIILALPEDQDALIANLKSGFIQSGFLVVDYAKHQNELLTAIETRENERIKKLADEVGIDLVVTGKLDNMTLEDESIGAYKSWQIELALKALKPEDARILASGTFKGIGVSPNEQMGMKKASEKLVQDVIGKFPAMLMKSWLKEAVVSRISEIPPLVSNKPPEIKIISPSNNEITSEETIRCIASITDDKSVGEILLYVNDSSLALDSDRHLSREGEMVFVNRIIPLNSGENIIRIQAFDQDQNKVEKEIKVIHKIPIEVEEESNLPQITIYSPIDGAIIEESSASLIGEITNTELSSVTVSVNGSDIQAELKRIESSENKYSLNQTIPLAQGRNVIKMTIQTVSGIVREYYITVFAQYSMDSEIATHKPEEVKPISDNLDIDKIPVVIEIESPSPEQKISKETVLVIGKVYANIPISGDVKMTVNGQEVSLSRGMKLLESKQTDQKENYMPINEEVRLTPGINEIEIVFETEDHQKYNKIISVSSLPNPEFQSNILENPTNKYAVIIGISKYQNKNIKSLNYASDDAESIYQVLIDPNGGGFLKENVMLLVDEQATREVIMRTIGEWLPNQVGSDDMVMLFYCGHGGAEFDPSGEEPDGNSKYLIPYDANPDSLFSTAILNSTITVMLNRIRSNQIVFLIDSCYSGGFTTGQELVRSISPSATKVKTDVYNDFSGSGRVIISASLPDQVSLESSQFKHGLFSYNLLKGISGEADINHDGLLALISEIYPFLVREVSSSANFFGYQQNPMLKCQITGDIVLSKVKKKE